MTSLLPPNSTPVERAVESLASDVRDLPTNVRDLWNPKTCPAAFLPWLAWALSVDSWRSDWPEATKRAVIAASPRVHRLKGTVAAVKAAISPFGMALVREWFDDPSGEMAPHTFVVVLAPRAGSRAPPTAVADMVDAIERAKPLRSHFTVEQAIQLEGSLCAAGFVRLAIFGRATASEAIGVPGVSSPFSFTFNGVAFTFGGEPFTYGAETPFTFGGSAFTYGGEPFTYGDL